MQPSKNSAKTEETVSNKMGSRLTYKMTKIVCKHTHICVFVCVCRRKRENVKHSVKTQNLLTHVIHQKISLGWHTYIHGILFKQI